MAAKISPPFEDLEPFIRKANKFEPGKKTLIVFLHGYRSKIEVDGPFIDLIAEAMPSADIYVPTMRHSCMFSFTRLTHTTKVQLDNISTIWHHCINREGSSYNEIILMGHSTGAVIARRLFVCAHGEIKTTDQTGQSIVRAPFESGLKKQGYAQWKNAIRRLVLLAPMSRGWSIDSVKSRVEAFKWRIGAFLGHLLLGTPTIFDIRRGAAYLIQTRLQWLELMRAPDEQKPKDVTVVQLLGTIDNLVSPDDNLDFSVDRGKHFFFLSVPNSSHTSILDVAVSQNDQSSDVKAMKRRELITAALSQNQTNLKAVCTPLEHLVDLLPPPPATDVANAVFVIHGIRDLGFWTQKIAAQIKKVSNGQWKSITPSYGYFTMAPFFLWWIRRSKVEWLMDQYVEARANYPAADFDYVGHSNGTYLLARALADYPACRFRNVVFAGSVVRRGYKWTDRIADNQVQRVLNYVATADWVVAIAPSAVRFLPIFDLGGAGVFGFRDTNVNNLFYVRGQHSAALVESQWDEIATFIYNGTVPIKNNADYDEKPHFWTNLLGLFSPLIALFIVCVLLYLIGYALFPILLGLGSVIAAHGWEAAGTVLLFIIYIVVTRF